MLQRKQLGRRARRAVNAVMLRLRLVPQAARAHAATMRPGPLLAVFAVVCVVFATVAGFLATAVLLRPVGALLFASSGLTERPEAAALAGAPADGLARFQFTASGARDAMPLNYAALPLTRPEADLLLAYLRPTDTYLEFGASGATLAFPRRVAAAYAVEHRRRVCAVLAAELSEHARPLHRLRAFCAPADADAGAGGYREYASFVDVPRNNISDVHFDAVFLNGPARLACALRALPQLRLGSRVFFPGFFARQRLHARVFDYFDEVARVRARASPAGGLVVLTPKRRFIGRGDVLEEREVHALYDAAPPEDGPASDSEADFAVVQRPDAGGLDYYAMAAEMSRTSARMRLALDAVALPIVAAMWAALQRLFLNFFLPLIAAASGGAMIAQVEASKEGERRGVTGEGGADVAQDAEPLLEKAD